MSWFPAVRSALASLLLFAMAALPAAAHVPHVERSRAYYGPIRICDPQFAFDVLGGEGYLWSVNQHSVRFGRHYLSVGRWLLADEAFRDIVHPLGTLDLPGVGRLERIALSSGNAPERTIVYLYDTHDRGPFPKMEIKSDAFDGSDRDLAPLGRFVFGERARAMCADIPEALRPSREREVADAFWVRPDRPQGPLTLCWAGLALDLRAGEALIPFWHRGWELFGVASGGASVTIQGGFASLPGSGGSNFDGPLAASPEFELRPIDPARSPFGGLPPALQAADGSSPRYVRLQRPVRLPHPELAPVAGVTFAFSGPADPTEIAAFVGRLRLRNARDACFEEAP